MPSFNAVTVSAPTAPLVNARVTLIACPSSRNGEQQTCLATDHRPPTTDHRPPTNDHRPTNNEGGTPTECHPRSIPQIPNPTSQIPRASSIDVSYLRLAWPF